MEKKSGTIVLLDRRQVVHYTAVVFIYQLLCVTALQREAESKAKVMENKCAKRLAVSLYLARAVANFSCVVHVVMWFCCS